MTEVVPSELAVAKTIAEGAMPSPSFHCGSMFVLLRISGTGVSYRAKHDQYVYRSPELWLSDQFAARCAGLPVLVGHPDSGVVDGRENALRNVGSIMFAFPRGADLMGIARIVDEDAQRAISALDLDTSPAVIFASPDHNVVLELEDDDTPLVVEGEPAMLDHVALCEAGVWGAGRGDDVGVQTNS